MHVSTVKRCSTCALLVNQHVNRLFRLRCMYNMSMCTCALLNRIVVLARICACVLYFCRTTEVLSETLKFENAGTDAAALRQGVRPRRAGLRRRRTGRRGKPSFKLAFSYSVCFTCASCLFMLRLWTCLFIVFSTKLVGRLIECTSMSTPRTTPTPDLKKLGSRFCLSNATRFSSRSGIKRFASVRFGLAGSIRFGFLFLPGYFRFFLAGVYFENTGDS